MENAMCESKGQMLDEDIRRWSAFDICTAYPVL